MSINFPSSPTTGQVFNAAPGVSYIYSGVSWKAAPLKTALSKNYIMNPSMLVSQQNGDTASAFAASGSYYTSDQWFSSWNISTSSVSAGRYRPSSSGTDTSYFAVTTGAALGVNDLMQLTQKLEGQRVADFMWGMSSAQQAVLRFAVFGNAAGNYTASIRNGGDTRSFLAPFSIVNGWQVKTIVIPGDVTGTWTNDSSTGIKVGITFAAGTTYQGAAGWQNGNKFAITGSTNGCSTSFSLHVSDVGFYLDPYKTGVAPSFEVPDFASEDFACRRYWYRGFSMSGLVSSASLVRGVNRHPIPMRVMPAMSIVGTPKVYDLAVTPAVTTISSAASNEYAADAAFVTAGGLTSGRASSNYWQSEDHYFAMDARM